MFVKNAQIKIIKTLLKGGCNVNNHNVINLYRGI